MHVRFSKTVKLFMFYFVAITFLFFCETSAWATEETKTVREVISKWQDVVITVKVVTNLRMIVEGREMNKMVNEAEATATVIDPSGLAVLSYSDIDPNRIYNEIFKQAMSHGEGMPKFNMETEITDVKMLMAEGNEVPAKIIMKDRDLDLVFVRPAGKLTNPLPAIDLTQNSKPNIADNIMILTRLGKIAGRIPSISVYRIEGIIKKPRTFYLIDQNAFSGKLGAPVFSTDGKVVGIFLLKVTDHGAKGPGLSSMFGGASRLGFLPVILPSEDILEVSKQALDAK
jgi:hypothetical protein